MIPKDARVLNINGSLNNSRIFISENVKPSRGGKGYGRGQPEERD